jgi:phospholipid/cholesterol/gamma-HCH transport system permease protein
VITIEKWKRFLWVGESPSYEPQPDVSDHAEFTLAAFTPTRNELLLTLSGRVSTGNAHVLRDEIHDILGASPPEQVVMDVGRITYLDSSGIAILMELRQKCLEIGGSLELVNVPERVRNLLDSMDTSRAVESGALDPPEEPNVVVQVGSGVEGLAENIRGIITFVGTATAALFQDLIRPWSVKWDSVWKLIERCGSDAIPIVLILSFLQGTVLAFQAAIQLRKFGANLFVADLVSVAICLEMGPLMVALIVCGRSGAAFAAQIGTMQVTEEIDALRVMAIDPVRYLVSPRILAVAFALPCLTLFADVMGVLGGCVVAVSSLDLTPNSYFNQVHRILEVSDVVKGLVKSVVFGIEIALVGCLRGFQARGGAESVGHATTSSVVTSIFMLTVTDALFALLYHHLPLILAQ